MAVRALSRAKLKVGADLWVLPRLGAHTTTQPSSIEEEGKGSA
jgi:hypothetical protein